MKLFLCIRLNVFLNFSFRKSFSDLQKAAHMRLFKKPRAPLSDLQNILGLFFEAKYIRIIGVILEICDLLPEIPIILLIFLLPGS